MAPLVHNSRKGKDYSYRKLLVGREVEGEDCLQNLRRAFGSDENTPCLDCGGGYITAYN